MKILALKCPKCQDLIYSRAIHDFHHCTCGSVSIDGGFDYCRVSHSNDLKFDDLKWVNVKVGATKHELYQDWNCRTDKFGVIKNDLDIIRVKDIVGVRKRQAKAKRKRSSK